ncbi:MAG: amino acid dehydrogenase [Chloroflexota bacterium]|nr:amino acid dehydrogenase [Chloroflexota bacterium]
MNLMDYMDKGNYEQVAYWTEAGVGLRAIIAIHDTTLGPALGGVRMRPYASEEEALLDVLRLARAMTYKAAGAGLSLGGGKGVIIGDPNRDKSEVLFRSFGRFVKSLGGRYITTEDVGTTVADMEYISQETGYVTGLPLSGGGSGDPSPATALGIMAGMRACLEEVFGNASLRGKTVAVQGVGKVGSSLARLLRKEGAILVVSDVDKAAAQRMREEVKATVVAPEDIYDVPCDVFSPNAYGAVLNDHTIPRLRCRIMAGGANNQLEDEERHGDALLQRGILYGPDYILNAGGIINLSVELTGYDIEEAQDKVGQVYHTTQKVIVLAKAEKISTARAANRLAESRIQATRKMRPIYLR